MWLVWCRRGIEITRQTMNKFIEFAGREMLEKALEEAWKSIKPNVSDIISEQKG